MDDFEDPADLDGDGEFDAIDMMILEDGNIVTNINRT
jgi:hypothetical protein